MRRKPLQHFRSWDEFLHFARAWQNNDRGIGPRSYMPLWYQAPMDYYPARVIDLRLFKNGKVRVQAGTSKFTADRRHLDRFRREYGSGEQTHLFYDPHQRDPRHRRKARRTRRTRRYR